MNLFFAYADVRAVLAVSKDGYSGHSGAIVPINFPPKSGVLQFFGIWEMISLDKLFSCRIPTINKIIASNVISSIII